MTVKWKDVEADERYQQLDDEQKARLKGDFWSQRVAGSEEYAALDEGARTRLHEEFFGSLPGEVAQGEIEHERTWGEAIKDVGLSGYQAASLAVQGITVDTPKLVELSGAWAGEKLGLIDKDEKAAAFGDIQRRYDPQQKALENVREKVGEEKSDKQKQQLGRIESTLEDDDKGMWDVAVSLVENPSGAVDMAVQSIADTVIGGAAGKMKYARALESAYKAGAKKGLTGEALKKEAEKKALKAAGVTGTAVESLQAAAHATAGQSEQIAQYDDETLAGQLPRFRELIAAGVPSKDARDILAAEAGLETAGWTGAGTFIGGALFKSGEEIAKVFTGRAGREAAEAAAGRGVLGKAKAVASGVPTAVVAEAGQEFLQSGAEALGGNIATRNTIDENQEVFDASIGKQAALGAGLGGLTGGSMRLAGNVAGVAGGKPADDAPADDAPTPPTDDQLRAEADAVRAGSTPETAAEDAEILAGIDAELARRGGATVEPEAQTPTATTGTEGAGQQPPPAEPPAPGLGGIAARAEQRAQEGGLGGLSQPGNPELDAFRAAREAQAAGAPLTPEQVSGQFGLDQEKAQKVTRAAEISVRAGKRVAGRDSQVMSVEGIGDFAILLPATKGDGFVVNRPDGSSITVPTMAEAKAIVSAAAEAQAETAGPPPQEVTPQETAPPPQDQIAAPDVPQAAVQPQAIAPAADVAPTPEFTPKRFALLDAYEADRMDDDQEGGYLENLARDLDGKSDTDHRSFNPDHHTMADAVAMFGGIDGAHAGGEFDIKTLNKGRVGKPVIRAKGKGLTPDGMAEALTEAGFRTRGGQPIDPNSLSEMLDDESRGGAHWSTHKQGGDYGRPVANTYAGGSPKRLAAIVRKYLSGADLGENQRKAVSALLESAYDGGRLGRVQGQQRIATAMVGAGFAPDDADAVATIQQAYEAQVPVEDLEDAILESGGFIDDLRTSLDEMAAMRRQSPEEGALDSIKGRGAGDAMTRAATRALMGQVADEQEAAALNRGNYQGPRKGTGQFAQPYRKQAQDAAKRAADVATAEGIKPESAAKMFEALFPRALIDAVTGFYKPEDRYETMQRAIDYIGKAPVNAFYVEVDLSNLGGLNKKMGNSEANVAYRRIAKVISNRLSTHLAKNNPSFDQVNFRHGGDEMSFFVFGENLDHSSIEDVLRSAQEVVWRYARDIGVHEIPHAKHENDPTRIGVNFYFGVSEVQKNKTPEATFKEADKTVEDKKEEPSYGYRKREAAGAARPDAGATGSQDGGDPGRGGDIPVTGVPVRGEAQERREEGGAVGAGRDGDEVRLAAGQEGREAALDGERDEGLTLAQQEAPKPAPKPQEPQRAQTSLIPEKTPEEEAAQRLKDFEAEKEAKKKEQVKRAERLPDGPLFDGSQNQTDIESVDLEEAGKILEAAGIDGKDRLDAIAKVRRGEYTLDDLRAAFPQRESAPAEKEEAADKKPAKVTPQIASERQLASMVSIAADSIADLRAIDVDRVLSEAPAHFRLSLAQHIKSKRKDLAAAVDEAVEDIASEGVAEAKPEAPQQDRIDDFGEKIGGARKDASENGGSKVGSKKSADERPAWARRFEVARVEKSMRTEEEGRWIIRDTRKKDRFGQKAQVGPREGFATQEEAEAGVPLVAVAQKHRPVPGAVRGTYEIWRDINDRKRVKVVDRVFESREEAMRYMAENAVGILETNTTFGEADLPRPDNVKRIGALRRNSLLNAVIDAADSDAKLFANRVITQAGLAKPDSLGDIPSEAMGNTRLPGDMNSALNKSAAYMASVNAKFLGYLYDAGAFSVEGYGSLDIPSRRLVNAAVLALGNDQKILRSVVELIPVDVMNLFSGKDFSPNSLFGDKSMLGDLLAVNVNPSVRPPDADTLALVRAVAGMAAKGRLTNAVSSSLEIDPAFRAGGANLSHGVLRSENISGRDFMSVFGFRSIEFGNWNNQADRQDLLNDAYDGLLDLAEVMNIPPKAISLNGDLALAFGARGHGLSSARAHYEPDRAVINLTKMNGAGSLAHEWFHGLDHYFGRQDGKASSEWVVGNDGTRSLKVKGSFEGDAISAGNRGDRSGMRAELRQAIIDVMKVMSTKAEQYVEDTTKADDFVGRTRKDVSETLAEIRKYLAEPLNPEYYKRNNKPASAEQLAEFDAIAERIVAGEALETRLVATDKKPRTMLSGMRWSNDALEQINAIMKAVRGRQGFAADNKGTLDGLRASMTRYSERLKMLADAQSGAEKTKAVPTGFRMDARELDQGRGEDYWTTPHEMAARAFQGYVEDKIAAKGGKSPFLNYAPERAAILTPWGWKRPYPHGAERKAINSAFDRLVDTIQTRETDAGVAMFKQGERSAGIPRKEAQRLLNKHDASVKAVQSYADLAPEIKAEARRQGAKPSDIKGVHWRGKSWVVADNVTADDIHRVALHEGMHGKLRQAYGREVENKMVLLASNLPGNGKADLRVLALAESQGISLSEYVKGLNKDATKTDRQKLAILTEELLTHVEEGRATVTGKLKAYLEAVVGAIRAFFRKHGFAQFAEMGITDIQHLLRQAREYGEQIEMAGEVPAFMVAWHGTPYEFDAFSLEHMGKGEGAQAYGWGLYFAGRREVAEHYRQTLSRPRVSKEAANEFAADVSAEIDRVADEFGDQFIGREILDDHFRKMREPGSPRENIGDAYWQMIATGDISFPGAIYRVDIPEDGEYLLWDKPVPEETVRKIAEHSVERGLVDDADEAFEMLADEYDVSGAAMYRGLSDQVGGDEAASKFLNEIGIPGIKYLDGTSRGAGDGSYNYVIFDDAAIKILDREQGPAFSRRDGDPEADALVAQYANVDGAPSEAEIREARKQYRETERAYGGREAYEKAKADGRTKLNYSQWVTVRTPNFKRWFGPFLENAGVGHLLSINQASGGPIPEVLNRVTAAILNSQILDSVISAIPVDVMNNLGGKQAAANMLLHDPSMFVDVSSAGNASSDVIDLLPRFGAAAESVVAVSRAKLHATKPTAANAEMFAAVDALQNNLVFAWRRFSDLSSPGGFKDRTVEPVLHGLALAGVGAKPSSALDVYLGAIVGGPAALTSQRRSQLLRSLLAGEGAEFSTPGDQGRLGVKLDTAMLASGFHADNYKAALPDVQSAANASKVTDPTTGEPMVVYHGTGNLEGLNAFDPEMTGKGNDQIGSGFYFTTDPEEADRYTQSVTAAAGPGARKLGGDGTPGIAPVFLAITNPINVVGSNLNDSDVSLTKRQASEIIKMAPGIRDLDDTPLGDFVNVWAAGKVTDRMIDGVAESYVGNQLIALEADIFRNNATAFREAVKAVLRRDGATIGFDGGQRHYVAFLPTQIKSATGNVGTFGPASDIRFSIAPGSGQFDQDVRYRTDGKPWANRKNAEAAIKARGLEATHKPVQTKAGWVLAKAAVPPKETAFRKAQRRWQDKFNRFRVIQDWLAENGISLTEQADVFGAETLMRGRQASRIEDFREKQVRPLMNRIAKAGISMAEVSDFLHAQHAAERNRQTEKVSGREGGSGMSDMEAAEKLAEYQKNPKLVALANEYRAITDQTRQMLLDSGIISQEQADAWQGAYQHYVPLKGGQDEAIGNKKPGGAGVFHRATGHEQREDGEWITENILRDHEWAIMQVERNRVGKALLNLALESGDHDLITIGKPEKRAVLKNGKAYVVTLRGQPLEVLERREDAEALVAALGGKMAGASPQDYAIETTTNPSVIYQARPQLADNETVVYVAGNKVRIQFNDPLMARSWNNLGEEQMNVLLRMGKDLNNWLSRAYTGYNPQFLFTNIARDLIGGTVNLAGEHGALFAGRTLLNYPKAWAALARHEKGGDKLIKEYRDDGGSIGAAYMSDLERIGADVEATYDEYSGALQTLKNGGSKRAAKAAFRKLVGAFVGWIEVMNRVGENALRVAAYQAAREAKMSRHKAAIIAKESTINFSRRGEVGQVAGAMYLFFNPAVQGTAVIAHALAKGKNKHQAQAMVAGLATLGYLLAQSFGGGPEDEWEKVSDYEKERNFLIWTGSRYLKIPVPYGYGAAPTAGRYMAEVGRGSLPMDGAALRLAATMIGEFTLFGAAADPDGDTKNTVFLLPTAAQIPASVAVNRTSFGSPVYPDSKFTSGDTPDSQQMFRSSVGTHWEAIAKGMNMLTGGDDVDAGKVDVSPETLKYLTHTFTGGAGKFVSDSVTLAANLAGGVTDIEAREVPIARSFVGSSDSLPGARSRFYRASDKVRAAEDRLRRAEKLLDGGDLKDKAAQIDAEQGFLLNLGDSLKEYSGWVKGVREEIVGVQRQDLPTAEKRQKIKVLEQQEAALYDEFMRIFKEEERKQKVAS